MKKLVLGAVLCLCAFASCTAQKKAKRPVQDSTNYVKDSVEFYETTFETRQKDYRELLIGEWIIDTMHRQAKLPGEKLQGVHIAFADSTFTGNAGCNRVSGKYTLKGTSIRFSDIISTKMACPQIETETALLQLLENTVSAYTVSKTSLWLRDGSSNIVFHASRK